MAVRVETYNDDGSLQINAATRMARILGMVSFPGSGSGTITHPDIATGTPSLWPVNWYSAAPGALPSINRSGNTLTWSYAPGSGGQPAVAWLGVW